MASGFIALGILSILYYGFVVWYTKRWNGTFTWFWAVFGLANIGIGILTRGIPVWLEYILTGIFIVLWMIFFCVEVLILCAMISVAPKNMKYIIILGAQIRGKRVTEALKRRLDRGIRYLNENPETIVIVSGGRGKGEDITEAEAMAEYLENCGIDANRICLEEKSTSTYENLKKSLAFIDDERRDKRGIVTNNFHIYRAVKLAKSIGYRKVYAITASSNLAVFPNYMVREFFAVLALFLRLRKHKTEE